MSVDVTPLHPPWGLLYLKRVFLRPKEYDCLSASTGLSHGKGWVFKYLVYRFQILILVFVLVLDLHMVGHSPWCIALCILTNAKSHKPPSS